MQKDKLSLEEQFEDLKRNLGTMSYMDWMSIPEIGDYRLQKNKRFEKYVPVPDNIIES